MKGEAHELLTELRVLSDISGIKAHFFGKIPELNVLLDRREAMALLAPYHQKLMEKEGLEAYPFVTAEQVHGNKIALVEDVSDLQNSPFLGADGLLTQTRGITLGIYVADCAPVWLLAKNGSAGALIHSGKKGTELGIVPKGICQICELANLSPADLVLFIGPCIRPPCYEVDFAATIREQARKEGVIDIRDDQICTACHTELYYSYRKECGLTGRMLATLTLLPPPHDSIL